MTQEIELQMTIIKVADLIEENLEKPFSRVNYLIRTTSFGYSYDYIRNHFREYTKYPFKEYYLRRILN